MKKFERQWRIFLGEGIKIVLLLTSVIFPTFYDILPVFSDMFPAFSDHIFRVWKNVGVKSGGDLKNNPYNLRETSIE